MSSFAAGVTGYAALVALLLGLAVASRRPGSRIISPAQLFGTIRRTLLGRLLLVLAWGWLGWHLFVR